jgi:hypothetical protein
MSCYICDKKSNMYSLFSKIDDSTFDEYFCKSCVDIIINATWNMVNTDYDYSKWAKDVRTYVNSHITKTLVAD